MALKDLTDIIQSGAVTIASIVAIYGISAWRVEFIGKRRIELAEDVLALFYQAKDAIEAMRSSFGYVGEGTTRQPRSDEKPEHKESLDQAYVLIERYNKYADVFSRLHARKKNGDILNNFSSSLVESSNNPECPCSFFHGGGMG